MLKRKIHCALAATVVPNEGEHQQLRFVGSGNAELTLQTTTEGVRAYVVRGENGTQYIAFRLADGSPHFFAEVEAKAAAKECLRLPANAQDEHTRTFCQQVESQQDRGSE